jgi:hypothetical protein
MIQLRIGARGVLLVMTFFAGLSYAADGGPLDPSRSINTAWDAR